MNSDSYCAFLMEKSTDLNDLLWIFKYIGNKIPVWTQAQGSNLSLKDESLNVMFIKPSGYRLDQVTTVKDLVALELNSLRKGLTPLFGVGGGPANEETYAKTINDSKTDKDSLLRPSMETGFHLALSRKYVFHFHSLAAIVMSFYYETQKEKMVEFLKSKTGLSYAFVDYATPGLELTQLLRANADKNIVFLKNHGVILNFDNTNFIHLWESVEREFCENFLGNQKLTEFRMGDPLPELETGVPLKILFPDFAVFLQRLSKCLIRKESSDLWVFNPVLVASEKDMYEVWVAYVLLYASCSRLEVLDDSEVGKLSNLPTEKFRLMMKS